MRVCEVGLVGPVDRGRCDAIYVIMADKGHKSTQLQPGMTSGDSRIDGFSGRRTPFVSFFPPLFLTFFSCSEFSFFSVVMVYNVDCTCDIFSIFIT